MTQLPIERRIRWSGILICAGLAILYLSLLSAHPLSFMIFLGVGCPLVLAGMLLYLYSLAAKDSSAKSNLLLIVFIAALPVVLGACGSKADEVFEQQETPKPSLPAFDPSSATSRVFGNVSLEGKAPETPTLKIGRDAFCQMSAMDILKQQSLVNAEGKLRNVIVYVRSGQEGRSYPIPEQPVTLDQQQCVYLPHVLTVMKGQKMKILNSDPTFHNVHAEAAGKSEFNIPQPAKGREDTETFSRTAMPFRIGCDFHSWMVSYVGVFDHPFHTTSGETGKYELRLPPGKYEVVAWHEKFGEQVSTVDVGSDASVELNFKFAQKS